MGLQWIIETQVITSIRQFYGENLIFDQNSLNVSTKIQPSYKNWVLKWGKKRLWQWELEWNYTSLELFKCAFYRPAILMLIIEKFAHLLNVIFKMAHLLRFRVTLYFTIVFQKEIENTLTFISLKRKVHPYLLPKSKEELSGGKSLSLQYYVLHQLEIIWEHPNLTYDFFSYYLPLRKVLKVYLVFCCT